MLLNWLTEKRASVVDAPVAVSAAAAAVALEPLEPAAGVDGGEARRRRCAVQLQVGANDVHHCRADARWNSHPAPAESGTAAAYCRMYIFYVWLVRVRA